jgi:tRNA-Thr(GGU) m(6)t(6)A37 methyltransferase TsaA
MPHMTAMHDSPSAFSCHPIAFARSPYARRIDAPHQSTVVAGTETRAAAEATIEFVEGFPATAWRDLAGFERIWLVFAFHRSEGWKAEVRPPRGGGKRSVLATRSPHRPNAIGLSAVELVALEEGVLRVRGMDLLDGTPILDIKPYVPYADAFPTARAGWIDAIDAAQGRHSAPGPRKPRSARPRGTDDDVNAS